MKKRKMHATETVKILIYLFLLLLQFNVQSQNLSSEQIKRVLKEFEKHPVLKSASLSFSMTDLQTGKKIASLDEHRALVPASSQKIISTALILNELSGDFKFETPFFLIGDSQPGGIFNGNLEIIGRGDPSFASDYIAEIPKIEAIADTIFFKLKERGISRIKGQIKVNEQFITDIPENPEWLWYDLGNYYGAGCFAFNYSENTARISLEAALEEGATCRVFRVQPDQLFPFYTSRVKGSKNPKQDELYVLGNSQSCKQEIWGEWKCCKEDTIMIRSALANPADVFIALLQEALQRKGIVFEEINLSPANEGEIIFSYASPPLKDLVKRALIKSVNLYCESFLHLYGLKVNGTTNRMQALIAMNQQLTTIVKEKEGVVMEDGCGLSPKNMFSASVFVKFLQWVDKKDTLKYYWQLLPDNSKQGPLAKWLKSHKNQPYQLRLKSGTMERVKSYTGYLINQNKPRYALSLIVNHYSCSGEIMNELIANLLNKILNNQQ